MHQHRRCWRTGLGRGGLYLIRRTMHCDNRDQRFDSFDLAYYYLFVFTFILSFFRAVSSEIVLELNIDLCFCMHYLYDHKKLSHVIHHLCTSFNTLLV